MSYKQVTLLFAMILLMVTLGGCEKITEPEPVPDSTIPPEYELVWSDEFDQLAATPDIKHWNYDLGYGADGWGNNEWQQYTNSTDNVRIENGNLVITAQCPSGSPGKRDGSVTSGRITTQDKFSLKYGKVQARIKPPKGAGIWPAFWMLGASYDEIGWPQCGEIDIMEISPLYHDDKTSLFTIHWWDDTIPGWTYYQTEKDFDFSLADDYHIFEVEWDDQRIIGKIDDSVYFIKTLTPGAMDEFRDNFFILLNVAVGGNLGGAPDATTAWPVSMLVDWVRAYQKVSLSSTAGIYSETHTNPLLNKIRLIDSQEWGGNRAVYDERSENVTPFEGDYVLSVEFINAGAGWGGSVFAYPHVDISDYTQLIFSMNTTEIADLANLSVELEDSRGGKTQAQISDYTPTTSGSWKTYEIPLSTFSAVDLTDIMHLGFWNPVNGTNIPVFGTLYLDNIYLESIDCSDAGSVSLSAETYTTTTSMALITVNDPCRPSANVVVTADNGSETIALGVTTNAAGSGTATLHFGPTDDNANRIAIAEGNTLTVTYTDANGNLQSDSAYIEAGTSTEVTMGIFTETHNQNLLVYEQIINTADWSGNPAAPDEMNTDVTPADGTYVLAVDYGDIGAGWGGIVFNFGANGQDISDFTSLHFSIDTSAMPALTHLVIMLEDGSAQKTELDLAAYTPEISNNWAKYEIPMSHFSTPNLSDIVYFGLLTPRNSANNILTGMLYFDDIYLLAEEVVDPPVDGAAGIFSESHTETVLNVAGVINSADWSGNSAAADLASTAVTPLDGSVVMAVEFTDLGAGWGGAVFNFGDSGQDMSGYSTLVFSIDTAGMPGFANMGIKFEDVNTGNTEVALSAYSPEISGNWATYAIPMSDFPGPNLATIRYLGLWNPVNGSGSMIFGTLYFDDIHLLAGDDNPPTGDTAGIFSESHTTPFFTNEGVINSADWSGNSAAADLASTAVTPVDGSVVMAVEFTDLGAGWGGAVFNFGDAGQDMTGYSKLVFSIDISAMPGFHDLGIKFEDPATGNTQVQLVSYQPTVSSNWATYEIPLSHFPGVNFTAVRYLGLWNPMDSSANMIFGTLYFDDIHLVD